MRMNRMLFLFGCVLLGSLPAGAGPVQAAGQANATIISLTNDSDVTFKLYYSQELKGLESSGNRQEITSGDTAEFRCATDYCFIHYLVGGNPHIERVYPERKYVFEQRNGRWAVYRFGQ